MELQDNDLIDMSAMIIENMFGEPGRKIFEYLLKNGYIAEERIATTLDVRSNEARKILQKLSDEAVVIPDRVKDEETGEVTSYSLRWILIGNSCQTLSYKLDGTMYDYKYNH